MQGRGNEVRAQVYAKVQWLVIKHDILRRSGYACVARMGRKETAPLWQGHNRDTILLFMPSFPHTAMSAIHSLDSYASSLPERKATRHR